MEKTYHEWLEWFKTNEPYEYGLTIVQVIRAEKDLQEKYESGLWWPRTQTQTQLVDAFDWESTNLGYRFWSDLNSKLRLGRKIIGVKNTDEPYF